MASSGDYSNGRSWGRPDLATPYLSEALKFIGLTDAVFESIAPTAGPTGVVEAAKQCAAVRLRAAAAKL
jgi:FMN-dependent NADH-azoreductase